MYYIAQTVFTSNDLKHYGVAGMKWYQHKAKSQNGTDSKAKRKQRLKTAAKVAGATALAGAAAYGAYKGSKYIKNAKGVSNYNKAKNAIKKANNDKNVASYYSKKSALKNVNSLKKVNNYYMDKQEAQHKIVKDTLKGIEDTKRLHITPGNYRYKKLGEARNRELDTAQYSDKIDRYYSKMKKRKK